MARIRTIKPEMRRSLTVSAWPYPVRWTFVGLLCYLDDSGRGLDDTRLVKSELYPLDDDMGPRKIEKHLSIIAAAGPLCRYTVDGRRYLHATNWDEHQRTNRPTPSRYPPCPLHEDSVRAHGGLSEDSVSDHGAVSEDSQPRARARNREQGREQGREDARARATPPPSCIRHPDGPDHGEPCRACKDVRVWRANQLLEEVRLRDEQNREAARWAAQAINDCPICDEYGWINHDDGTVTKCTHQAEAISG